MFVNRAIGMVPPQQVAKSSLAQAWLVILLEHEVTFTKVIEGEPRRGVRKRAVVRRLLVVMMVMMRVLALVV